MRQGSLREHPGRCVGLVAVVGLIVGLAVVQTSSSAQEAGGSTPSVVIGECAPGTQSPGFIDYDLGQVFSDLPLTARVQNCSPNGPPVWDGDKYVDAASSIANQTLTYGDCDANLNGSSEGGCSPPLEIQLWPQCARKPALYTQTDETGAQQQFPYTMLPLDQLTSSLLPQLPQNPSVTDLVNGVRGFLQGVGLLTTQLDQAVPAVTPSLLSELGRLPAASFGDGTQIELYTGDTTIVVFANDPAMAKSAATAMGLKLALQPGGIPSGDLMARATSTSQCG